MQRKTALLLLVLMSLLAACGSSASSAAPSGGGLVVKDAWARAGAAGGQTAVYFTIVNGATADALTGAAADFGMAGVHETTTDANGMTGMHEVPSVAIPAGGTVEFKPGSYHVMVMGLKKALNAGDQVQVTLTFQNAGKVNLTAEVRAS